MRLSEQAFLITGGANGIGRYLVDDLASHARRVVVLDRDEAALGKLAAANPDVSCVACDLTGFTGVHEAVAKAYELSPGPTVLVNNAGLIHSEPLLNLLSRDEPRHSVETWHRVIEANLTTVFYVTSCVVERMVQARTQGLIVNITSISAAGNAGQSAYSAAKAGVNALTVTWSKELGMFGIRSVAIAPGFLDAPSTRRSLTEGHLERWRKATPVGRLGELREIATALRFVVENDFYNGRVLELDGGLRL